MLGASVAYAETATGQYRAVLTPDRSRLRSGTTAVTDAAGNALAVTKTCGFTVR